MKEASGRLYYSIGEVSEMLGIKSHTLHYWESAFPSLKPHKNQAGNRCYRPHDLDTLKLIDKLLNGEGYSIEGARKQIDLLKKKEGQLTLNLKADNQSTELLDEICIELEAIVRDLSRQPRTELDG
ncbi:MAG: MerR family transcriptional regulator [Candidatus Sabulitectum sp.]|nr:MerR family transcriptional regulator [Candidatus Sabulitectum sp.]